MPELTGFFCDDVRIEMNGKFILIGAYTADMVVQAYPWQGNLCPVILASMPPSEVTKVAVRVASKAGANFGAASFELKPPALPAPVNRAMIPLPPVGVTLSGDDTVQLFVAINDGDEQLAVSLPVYKGELPRPQ